MVRKRKTTLLKKTVKPQIHWVKKLRKLRRMWRRKEKKPQTRRQSSRRVKQERLRMPQSRVLPNQLISST
uniref:At2g42540 n=1 Tax=Arabidopsis thaliana TaxID=3702 RepID=Q9FPI5_ARATH|nr:At2g42540 [Arabidopsis thaliana]